MGRHKQKGVPLRNRYLNCLATIYRTTCWLNNLSQRKRYTQAGAMGRLLWSLSHIITRKLVHIQARMMTKTQSTKKNFKK